MFYDNFFCYDELYNPWLQRIIALTDLQADDYGLDKIWEQQNEWKDG